MRGDNGGDTTNACACVERAAAAAVNSNFFLRYVFIPFRFAAKRNMIRDDNIYSNVCIIRRRNNNNDDVDNNEK